MNVDGVAIEDTFAEAFAMVGTRLLITADRQAWAETAALSLTGFATSVIACGCEAAVERSLSPEETPDGRPGVAVLIFAMSAKGLAQQVGLRVGQCVLTSAGSACFAGLDGEERVALGGALRRFGDGFQVSKLIGAERYWRVPVMDGEFLCEDSTGVAPAVGGGNLILLGASREGALAAAERAVAAIRRLPNVALPFPGGIVRSGSKVGSKYRGQIASTNDAFCPTLRGLTETRLPEGVESALEIVIDGLSEQDVAAAMRVGIAAACEGGAAGGLAAISAGNYGGQLGQFRFHLRELA